MSDFDLESVIADSITDATLPDPIEATPEAPEAVVEATPEVAPEPVTTPAPEPPQAVPEVDDFDKKYGLAQTTGGRENRIPYSRVRKIVDNAVKEANTTWEKKSTSEFVPSSKYVELENKYKQLEPVLQEYNLKLQQVGQFEQVMLRDAKGFLGMLSQMPQYAELLAPVFNPGAAQPHQAQTVPADMPQPDVTLSDGSKVYSMEGLAALNAWNRAEAKKEALAEFDGRIKQFEQRYRPLEDSYRQYQTVQNVLPKIQQQIKDARTWPQFNENEAEIVKVLQSDPNISLERAYQTVVLPKLQPNRDQIRKEILAELKQAPRSTSAPASATRGNPQSSSKGPRNLEDVIADSIRDAGLK